MNRFLISLLIIPFFLLSCQKEDSNTKPSSQDLFNTPLVDWTLTKSQVKAKETHTLIEDTAGEDILLLFGPWDSHGDGSLAYSGDKFFSKITYGFYNSSKKLECVTCSFDITNFVTEEKVLSFMQSKYNKEYSIHKNDSGNNTYIFKTSYGIVVFSVGKKGIITYTKAEHEWYY